MSEFLNSNEWQWCLARTIVQCVIGVFVANIDLIVGWCVVEPQVRGLICRAGNGDPLVGDGGAWRRR